MNPISIYCLVGSSTVIIACLFMSLLMIGAKILGEQDE